MSSLGRLTRRLGKLTAAGWLTLGLCACPAQGVQLAKPEISGKRLTLAASTANSQREPLYDRVDLLLLGNVDHLQDDYPGSTEYFAAIDSAGGQYLGGNYLEDSERSSGRALYELELPAVQPQVDSRQAWLLCLELEGTGLHIRQRILLQNWPGKQENDK